MKFRFSTRRMFVIVAIVALCLGWVTHRIRRRSLNERTIVELRQMGTFATLDDGTVPVQLNGPWGWLESAISTRTRKITTIYSVHSDAILEKISWMPDLIDVHIHGAVTDVGLQHLVNTKPIRRLAIQSDNVTTDGLSKLSLPNLESLTLSGSNASDECLAWVKQLTGLTELDISGPGVTDVGMKHLAELHELTKLALRDTKVTDAGLAELRDVRKLDVFDLSGTATTPVGLAHLVMDLQGRSYGEWFPSDVYSDQDRIYATLRGEQYENDFLPYLIKAIPDLTELSLTSTGITSAGVASLGSLKKMEHLTVVDTKVDAIAGLPNVERLSLISLEEVPKLANMPKLKAIAFSFDWNNVGAFQDHRPFERSKLQAIVDFGETSPALTTLSLQHSALRDEHVEQVSVLNLETLDLSATDITDESLKHLAKMSSLRSLQLHATRVTDAGVAALTQSKLTFLGLNGTRVSDASAQTLMSMKTLRELQLLDTQMTLPTLQNVKQSLPNCDVMIELPGQRPDRSGR